MPHLIQAQLPQHILKTAWLRGTTAELVTDTPLGQGTA